MRVHMCVCLGCDRCPCSANSCVKVGNSMVLLGDPSKFLGWVMISWNGGWLG